MSDPAWLSARELLAAYAAKDLSPVEAVDACATRIAERNEALNAFTVLCLDRAREEARTAEAAWAGGQPDGPLCGVPFAAKDLFDTAGLETACGSPILAGRVPQADAAAVARARERGAILLGKTATHEFAWGLTMFNESLGHTRNPWDPERTPGGSSGGSGVALATGMAPLALGSDTGGSIRLPAAFCGVVGLKPTRGRVSLAGCWPLARTLDHAGPMARTPEDAALLLEAIAGPDPGDPGTIGARALAGERSVGKASGEPGGSERSGSGAVAGLTIGVPKAQPVRLAPDVATALAAAADALARQGATVREIALPDPERTEKTFGTTFAAEALDTHVRAGLWPDRRDEYGSNVRPWLERAERVDLRRYLAAQAERERLRAEMLTLFDTVDLLLTPVSATGAPRLTESEALRDDVIPFTCPQDLFGLPACALRAGTDDAGVPVGVQLTGPPWEEARVLQAAQALHDA